jgi:hypothetical protein
MEISFKELWTVAHGMGFGAIYLLAFGGAIAGIYSFRPELTTHAGIKERITRLNIGLSLMAIMSWLTVISGTWIVYIWYRAKPGEGADLMEFPRYFLLSKPSTKEWHEFGMEWKEHVAWIVPFIATSVAYSVYSVGEELAKNDRLKKALLWLILISFCCAAVPGVFGAFINKIAATR